MEYELSCSNYGSMLEMSNEQLTNCYLPTNWDNSNDQNDPFESALSSMVSSPSATPTPSSSRLTTGGGIMIKELIGRLGSICDSSNDHILPNYNNSTNNSCYSTPLSSPPPSKINLNPNYYGNYPNNVGSFNNNYGGKLSSRVNSENNNGDSREGSSITGQNLSVELKCKSLNDSNSKKRKSIPKGKVKGVSQCPPIIDHHHKVEQENEESKAKKSKVEKEENKGENAGEYNSNKDEKGNNNNNGNNDNKEVEKAEPPKDYIHVRARRGQATDSHSLAERVRREKISERMKFLQDLVPNCNKVTGKATVLDEIINYVQSLQRQVEFLSMKLSTVNPTREFNMEALFSKDMFQSRGSPLSQSMYSMDQNSVQPFPFGYQSTHHMSMSLPNGGPNVIEDSFSVNPMNATTIRQNPSISLPSNDVFDTMSQQLPTLWEDDLQSIIQMGIIPNQTQGTLPSPQ